MILYVLQEVSIFRFVSNSVDGIRKCAKGSSSCCENSLHHGLALGFKHNLAGDIHWLSNCLAKVFLFVVMRVCEKIVHEMLKGFHNVLFEAIKLPRHVNDCYNALSTYHKPSSD